MRFTIFNVNFFEIPPNHWVIHGLINCTMVSYYDASKSHKLVYYNIHLEKMKHVHGIKIQNYYGFVRGDCTLVIHVVPFFKYENIVLESPQHRCVHCGHHCIHCRHIHRVPTMIRMISNYIHQSQHYAGTPMRDPS